MGGKGSGRPPKVWIEGKTCREFSRETGISHQTLRARALAGWKGEDIKRAPVRIKVEGKTLRQIADETGLPMGTLKWRYRHGIRTLKEITEPKYALRAKPKM